ncbi:hypothetical protein DL991_02755 [Amycolatopsis sp. WAC 01375]|uniref:hypothetical protein n=1 Tax=Amycolatopsis sp. WAC 01375 TaxID=2203194 RepID=UPI000F7ADDF1|nr:hypothetical protein [Amycolatopsis sp. WAC 01375]RSM83360.1 hypothetical protein DL991_02755 [Amycolatopsis sp. WAC 01375]
MTTNKAHVTEEEYVAGLSPQARDQYYQDKASGEAGDGPFAIFQRLIAQGKAQQHSENVGDKTVDELTKNKDVKYVEGLEPPNGDYLGYDHQKLEQFVNSNLNVEQVSEVSTAYHDIHKAFDTFSRTMDQAVTASQGTWEGDAAGNAQGYFKSLSKWSESNSQNAKLASETIYDQGTAASTVKNTMPKPIPFDWKDEVGGWMTSNPFNLGDNIDKSIQKQKDSQEAHTQAASAMNSYDKSLYEAASKQPAFAEPPKFGEGGGGGIDDPGKRQPYQVPPGSNTPGSNNPGNTYIPPGSGGGGSGGGGGGGGGYGSNLPGPGSTTGSGSLPSGTTPSGFQNGPAPITTPGPNNNTAMPMSPMPMAPPMMGGGMGDSEYNSRSGRGGGGGGFGPGSGAGSTPGSGSASGAARPGGVGAAESAAGRGMGGLGGGAAGRGGPGMGGGMGGRGQQADGDEDTEHQRPTYLVEGDPDEVFGTDMRTAPPVIGE